MASSNLIASDFETLSRDELHKRLTYYILELLQYNPEKLVNLMYRHDVDENLFKKALLLETDEEKANEIAGLVINRELEKVEMRKKFKKGRDI